jgi:signal recognition particle GTPase
VYFKEFSTGRNLWLSKPRVMIAKVAEMHALRKACPEELAQAYTEEEIEQAPALKVEKRAMTLEEGKAKLGTAKDMAELRTIWSALPMEVKADKDVQILKEDLKLSFDPNN